jgi:3,5-epimerase/4-reductase
MSVLDELLPLMIKMAFDGKTGIYNFTNPGVISHNEILSMYRAIVDPSFTWKNFNIEDQARVLAAGRSNNFLDTEKLEGQYAVTPIREAVEEALRKMATRRLIKRSP